MGTYNASTSRPPRPWDGIRLFGRRKQVAAGGKGAGVAGPAKSPIEAFEGPAYQSVFDDMEALPDDLSKLLDAAQFQVDFQVKMAERLDNKARGLAVMCSAIVAGSLTFSMRHEVLKVRGHEWIVLGAGITVVLLVVALILTARSVILYGEKEIDADNLRRSIPLALKGEHRVSASLVTWNSGLAIARQRINNTRAQRMVWAQWFWFASLVAALAVFIGALIALG